jgi:rSAM/selenodomain-associated transferase 1
MRPVILVFAKAPIPGRVKTRLHTVLTPAAAARLHKAFVFDTLESLNQLASVADIELYSDVATGEWPFPYRLQSEGDLGQRMLTAMSESLNEGRPWVMVVGADSPTLPPDHLASLAQMDADVGLGPTEDGGYYAIRCRRVHPDMFAGVAWSTGFVLSQTQAACHQAGLTVQLGPPWWDVDEPADLERLRAGELPRHTGQAIGSPGRKA